MEVKIRISAKAADSDAAWALIAPIEERIRAQLGDVVFGADEETVERLVAAALFSHGWRVGTVEDATLGQVGARLALADPDRFAGSIISKGLSEDTPDTDVALKVGPIGPDLDPGPRTTRQVEMTVITPVGESTRVFDFGGDDERVRSFATIAGLHMIRIALEEDAG
jgi:hypothetical protein